MSIEGGSDRSLDAERLANLTRQAADILIEVGFDGRVLWISDSVEHVLARPADDFMGRSFVELIVPEDREPTLAVFQKIIATGAEPTIRFRVPRADDLRVEFETTIRHATLDGQPRLICVARDVTQQSAERAVAREREAHYRKLVESGARPAAILRGDGRVAFANLAFSRAFGRGSQISELVAETPNDARRSLDVIWMESIESDGSSKSGAGDFLTHDADGEEVWYTTTWETLPGDEREPLYAIHFEDVTARKRVELALRSIARGLGAAGRRTLEQNIDLVARALDFERFVVAGVAPERRGFARIYAGRAGPEALQDVEYALEGLPEAAVAAGDSLTYPSGLTRLMPAVAELLSPHFESFAGTPLRRADGETIGYLAGYGRKPIADLDLARSLLSAFATQAAASVDRRKADDEIRSTRDRFEALAAQAHEILTEIDVSGRVLYASEASLPILGYAPEEMLGKSIPQLVHPGDREANRRSQEKLFDGAHHTFVVNRIRHKDGHWRRLESRTTSFRAPDGSMRALILSRDVTDRRSGELGRDLLYRIVQAGHDLVFVSHLDGRIAFANPAARHRLSAMQDGATEPGDVDPVEGRRIHDVLSEADARRLQAEILPGLTPAQPWSGTLHLRGPEDGDPIETEAIVFVFTDDLEDRSLLAVSLCDVDERRRVEEALAESELRLRQAQKMEAVGRLAGGIAHDFNNLLTAIIGYGDLVVDELGEGHVARGDAEEILRAAERAGSLTRQLLAFSRRQVLQPEPVDLNHIVADIDRMMRRLIGEDIELHTVQNGELRSIVADPGQIEQVIVNLVVNAQDAMPRGGRLTIETIAVALDAPRPTASGELAPGPYAALRVADTGIGMSAETVAQIFEPFFTTKEAHRGTGLGLATVYGIVEQAGGQIDVETCPGEGAAFTIYFPVARAGIFSNAEDDDPAATGGRETVLLLEDSTAVRRLVQRTLERAGYTVLEAESATAALRHCTRHEGSIDLLVSDVVLPKSPGPEIARRAQEIRPDLRVLFMSGFTDETLARNGLYPPNADLIEKPFTPTALLARVRTALDAAQR